MGLVNPFNSIYFDAIPAVPLLICVVSSATAYVVGVVITRIKANSVQLDLPTGAQLGKKGIVKPILNLELVLVRQSVGIGIFP